MIRLEKFDHNYYHTLISWVDTAEALMQFAGPAFGFPLTEEQLNSSLNDTNRHAFRVIDRSTEATIGHAEIFLTSESAYLARILIGEPALRGKGLGQQIVRQLLQMVFEGFNQSKAELNVFDWNTAAIKCYEKAGFVLHPDKKAEREVNGKKWTVLNMAIDRKNWMEQC